MGDLIRPSLSEVAIEVTTFYAYCWTNPSQNVHVVLFFIGEGHRGIKIFIGVLKMGAHFVPKIENGFLAGRRPLIKIFHKIKVVWDTQNGGPDEVRSNLQGCLRPKLRLPLSMLTVGPILPKICMGCFFSTGSNIGVKMASNQKVA